MPSPEVRPTPWRLALDLRFFMNCWVPFLKQTHTHIHNYICMYIYICTHTHIYYIYTHTFACCISYLDQRHSHRYQKYHGQVGSFPARICAGACIYADASGAHWMGTAGWLQSSGVLEQLPGGGLCHLRILCKKDLLGFANTWFYFWICYCKIISPLNRQIQM